MKGAPRQAKRQNFFQQYREKGQFCQRNLQLFIRPSVQLENKDKTVLKPVFCLIHIFHQDSIFACLSLLPSHNCEFVKHNSHSISHWHMQLQRRVLYPMAMCSFKKCTFSHYFIQRFTQKHTSGMLERAYYNFLAAHTTKILMHLGCNTTLEASSRKPKQNIFHFCHGGEAQIRTEKV